VKDKEKFADELDNEIMLLMFLFLFVCCLIAFEFFYYLLQV